MESLQTLALKSIPELTTLALSAPRQLSLCMTQLVQAKQAEIARLAGVGNLEDVKRHVKAANRFYLRAQEDEKGQLRRVDHVQAVVEANGNAQDASKGKHVSKLAMGRAGAIWQSAWTGNR